MIFEPKEIILERFWDVISKIGCAIENGIISTLMLEELFFFSVSYKNSDLFQRNDQGY